MCHPTSEKYMQLCAASSCSIQVGGNKESKIFGFPNKSKPLGFFSEKANSFLKVAVVFLPFSPLMNRIYLMNQNSSQVLCAIRKQTKKYFALYFVQ